MGIHKLFEFADLTGLASNFKDLYVSDLIQNTIINVTEFGIEATAIAAGWYLCEVTNLSILAFAVFLLCYKLRPQVNLSTKHIF